MKSFWFVFLSIFALMVSNVRANMPVSDLVNKAERTIEEVQEAYVTPLQEGVTELKSVVNEGTSIVKEGQSKIQKAKEVAEKAKGAYEKAKNFIEDPVGAATSTLGSLADMVNEVGDSADKLEEEYVASEYPTFEEQKRKKEKIRETQNKRAADTYAMAFTHRIKLIEEGKQPEEDFNAEDQDTVLKAINSKVSEIVVRLNYIQMFEAMTDELTYFQALSSFDKENDE